jgi:hypothetical protein
MTVDLDYHPLFPPRAPLSKKPGASRFILHPNPTYHLLAESAVPKKDRRAVAWRPLSAYLR